MTQHASSRLAVVVAYATMCLIWGSTWMVIKIGLRGAPPMTAVALRFVIAGLLILAIVAVRRIPLPRHRNFLVLSGFLGIAQFAVPYVLVYWGEQHISSGLTAVVYSTMPLGVALLARFVLGDRLTFLRLVGIGLGILGVSIIFSDNLTVTGRRGILGVSAVLLSVFFACLSSVVVKKYSVKYHPVAALLLPFLVGGLLVSGLAIPIERSNPLIYDASTWATIVYLAVIGSVVAFTLFFWTVKRVDVTVVSYQTFIIPMLAVLFGWLFLDETVSARLGAGAAFILLGIAVATFRRPRRRSTS